MIDEDLIAEVQQHGVIYNRQKYFLNNGMGPVKYESKEAAWQIIAMNLATDVDSCKKRWKYLRERYVQQRKQCDPPTYEHLSRPYLEKMKFLDQHIQPRKSYRNVPNFLGSPNANSNFGEYMDSSRSNGSSVSKLYQNPNYSDSYNSVKSEPEEFTSNTKHEDQIYQQSLQQHLNLQQQQQQQQQETIVSQALNQSAATHAQYRENEVSPHLPSSSSSLKSPLSSSPVDHNEVLNENSKKPRVQDDDAENSSENESSQRMNISNDMGRQANGRNSPVSTYQNDFLLSLYQQFPQNRQIRTSEQLLGELVTSELLRMNRERRRVAQKKILEILFFEE